MILFRILLSVVVIVFFGCNRFILKKSIESENTGWKTFGGSNERTNFSSDILIPPLEQVWEYDASAGFAKYGPTVYRDVVCTGNLRGEIHLIDKKTGISRGSKNFGDPIYASPIIENNILYFGLSGEKETIYSYNLTHGSVIWKKSIGRVESSFLSHEDKLFVNTIDNGLLAIKKTDGSVLWHFTFQKKYRQIKSHSSPASDGDIITYGTDDGLIFTIKISDGSLFWKYQAEGAIIAAPVISDGKIFIGSTAGKFYAFDVATGNVLWSKDVGSKVEISAAAGNNALFVTTAAGDLICLNSSDGELRWKKNIGSVIGATPLISGNILYVGCYDKQLYAIDVGTGNVIWKYKTNGRIISTPVINKDMLFLLTDDRTVIALVKKEAR
ncbi:MAG: PQQ-binding-like beta-propeller repeat protein [Ignavibacteriales bacterium]|nr:PQQ-binding-like beta-propeller repeat protein [Ignavibacteriales bacterium]